MPDWRSCRRAIAENIHGILRTLYLAPLVGDFRARQIGSPSPIGSTTGSVQAPTNSKSASEFFG